MMHGSINLIGVDRHPPAQYPRPGQWMSPHHRVISNDKKMALKRDYIGIDIAKHGKYCLLWFVVLFMNLKKISI